MKKFTMSFVNAARGVALAFRGRNFRIMLCFAFYALAAGLITGISSGQWSAVLLCSAAVLGAECFNTAVERLCDTLSPERNEGIRAVKDMSAAAVLICAFAAAVTGGIIFFRADKVQAAVRFARGNIIISAALTLLFPVWLGLIIGRNNNDK